MPLSDHEQRILEEIERQLIEQDPKFARNVASRARKGGGSVNNTRSLRRGIVLLVLGIVALFGFFAQPTTALGMVSGVASFLLMLGGIVMAYHSLKRSGEERASRRGPGGDHDNSLSKRVKDLPSRVRKLRRRDAD